MNVPVRTKGLQVEAVLCLGNSLYSVLVAGIIGAAVLILSDTGALAQLTNARASGGLASYALSMVRPFTLTALLAAYFVFDWYDLNQVTYCDTKIGRAQLFLWLLAICILSVEIVLCVAARYRPFSVLAVAYFAYTALLRDLLITYDHKKSAPHNFWRGALFSALLIVATVLVAWWAWFCYSGVDGGADSDCALWVGVCAWALALGVKAWRSMTGIARKYEEAVKQLSESVTRPPAAA